MTDHQIVHLVIIPPASIGDLLLKKAGPILRVTPYNLHPILSAMIPKIVRQFEEVTLAAATVKNWRNFGLVAFWCLDSDLYQTLPPLVTT